jgi:hypothetical protein
MLAGTGLGVATGALVGWLTGGPGGTLILASEGVEIAAVAAAAGIMGGAIGANRTVSFWSRRFVKFAYLLRRFQSERHNRSSLVNSEFCNSAS